ncbi:amidohydrolase family protein [Pseudohaliea sp.]|uniref:amidohydrolase family protein n=1 Tax=Pseudohaliea sp. TaxID=2740289 RepID=UPI0032ED7367
MGARVVKPLLWTLSLVFAALTHAETLLVQNVTVLPMNAQDQLDAQDVLIREGRIAALADHGLLNVPADTTVIDGRGRTLLPGLSDMHAHIAGYAEGERDEPGEATITSVAENQLLMYLATGVTLLRDTAGSEAHFTIRERLERGDWLGPQLRFTSPVLEGERAVWEFSTKVTEPGEAAELIAGYAERGYWGIKTYHTLDAEVFEAILDAARANGLPVIGHVPFEVGIDEALSSGMLTIEHLRGYDFDGMDAEALFADGGRSRERFVSLVRMSDARMDELVALTVAEGVWNCPTLAINRFLAEPESRAALVEEPRYRLVHPELRSSVENASALDEIFSPDAKAALREALPRSLELVRRLHAAGGRLLIGTDAVVPAWVPGFTPIDEMKMIEQSGVPRADVLRMATVDAARLLGLDAERGTIAVGKGASLILVSGNPLEDLDALWQLEGVIHAGRWHSHEDLQAALEAQAARFPALDATPARAD